MKIVEFQRPDGKPLKIEIIKYQADDFSRNTTPDRHRHNFHSIFFVLNGYNKQEIDFSQYEIAKNQVMIIPKGAIHWEMEQKDYLGFVILFTDDFFSIHQKLLLHGFLQYAIALRKILINVEDEMASQVKQYFEILLLEQENTNNQNQTFLLQNLMLALLNKLEGMILNLPEIHSFLYTRKPFQRFIELVEENYNKQERLDFYTAQLNVTDKKLNEITKKNTGQTATNFIIDRIILEAKRELCFSEKTVKEIAFSLGYDSQYYFSRIFKKRTNMSPEQFRTLHAE
ncbi:MAG: AraC family transcriptional regulator [Bacteroidota bacterium]